MRDKDGFVIPCKHCDWMIYDEQDNKDYICLQFGGGITGYHHCYGDENCRYYEPKIKGAENEERIRTD